MDQLPHFLSALGSFNRTRHQRAHHSPLDPQRQTACYQTRCSIQDCPPDTKELLTRLQALEDLEDVQASQASRLTDLERQVFILQAQRISGLEARITELERSRRRRRKPKPSTAENATSGSFPEPPISS